MKTTRFRGAATPGDVRTVAVARRPVVSRPIRPPAHMPPVRLADLEGEYQDEWERSWRELNEAQERALADDPLALKADPVAMGAATGPLALGVALAQAVAAALVALVAASLTLAGQDLALWALALALLTGGGAALAYLLLQRRKLQPLGAAVLLGSQLAILVWAFELDGPRAALLTFVPAVILLALRLSGRSLAVLAAAVALGLYLAFALLQVQLAFWPTALTPAATLAQLDPALAAAGIVISLVAALGFHATRTRALEVAERRRRDAEDLHLAYALLQTRLRRDAGRMQHALAEALGGQGGDPVAPLIGDISLHQLAELLDSAAVRLAAARREREDRVRLERALRRLGRAIEQLEMGRLAAWPEPSGTIADALVAGLRRVHPDPGGPRSATRRHNGASGAAITAADTARALPERGQVSGVILPWRPSRSRERAPLELPPDWAALRPVSPVDDDSTLD